MLRLFGVRTDPDGRSSRPRGDRRRAALGHSEGAVEKEDRDRLLGALDLGHRTVEEIMLHRSQIEMIDADAPRARSSRRRQLPHTRLPVWQGRPREHRRRDPRQGPAARGRPAAARARRRAIEARRLDVLDVAREPYFVPETTPLDEQMRQFLRRRRISRWWSTNTARCTG
jgi:Mg2+/Co2+ transporter CorB